jgi:Fe-S-cluster-containing hydrogenase component 2
MTFYESIKSDFMKKSSKEQIKKIRISRWQLVCNPDICGGCRTCEAVCSLTKEDIVNPRLSRIQVVKDELGGYVSEAMPCKQCAGPECLFACPTKALHVDEKTGARVIDATKCSGCKLCIKACIATPKRVYYNAEKKVAFKCDLCRGDPQCVKYCPTGALTYVKV